MGRGGRRSAAGAPEAADSHRSPAPAKGIPAMDTLDPLTFEPWADPTVDPFDCHPEGTYSRLVWLPTVGPSSWLVWGTLASQLRREATVTWDVTELAVAHGLQRGVGQHGMVRRTLRR